MLIAVKEQKSNFIVLDKERKLTSVEMILNEQNLLVELDRIMLSSEFDDEYMHDVIMQPMPDLEKFKKKQKEAKTKKVDANVPPELRSLYGEIVLTKEQEFHQFRKYNFLKYQAYQLLQKHVDIISQHKIARLLREAIEVKKFLIQSNMRLALHGAKSFAAGTHQLNRLWELFSEASVCIMRCVICFEFSRGFKFSTYATWAIRSNLGRETSEYVKHQQRYLSGYDDENQLDKTPIEEENVYDVKDFTERNRRIIRKLLLRLNDRSAKLIKRYMLDDDKPTLDQLGTEFQITKERVRQINTQSMKIMREIVEREGITFESISSEAMI